MKQAILGLITFLLAFPVIVLAREDWTASRFISGRHSRSQTRRRPTARKPPAAKPRIDYSNFSHRTHVEQENQTCASCHKFPSKNWKSVRKGDAAFPDVTDFPEHQACLNCHRTQFFARERPAPVICGNCHVAVTPRDTARYPFPSLGEPFLASKRGQSFVSEFKVLFPHDKHIDVVGFAPLKQRDNSLFRLTRASFNMHPGINAQDAKSKSCNICHETYQPQGKSNEEFVTKPPGDLPEEAFWLKKGAFQTQPTTHAACSSCHSEDAGIPPSPTDCAACHKFAPATTSTPRDFDPKLAATMGIKDWLLLRQWSKRSAGRYRHEFDVHSALSCVDCHNPATMNTLEEKTLVSVKACAGEGGCHIETNIDGILNYEIEEKRKTAAFQCSKCHIVLGKQAVPQNHLEAIPKPVAK
jgi:nitrate/TMAO reductase-like tetraheme cytochrome c subunit